MTEVHEAFPDRRELLFGRMADVRHLTSRAREPGLTVVAGRPLMGKSWTLTEVARLLMEEGRFVVGCHESKGAESSHLLYAVSNLYARWLVDSSMRDQAISLWERHKDSLVPRIGQMVGGLFEKLAGKQMPVAGAVRLAFDGLAEAQKDLLSGGLQFAPLPYDEALSLTELVAKLSQHRIVLILDAWEKTPSLRSEFATLETFLKHREDWPHTHIFLAVRNPELDSTEVSVNDEAYRRACDLCRISGAAQLYELPPIDQQDPKERDRIISFIREALPAAQDVSELQIFEMIDGYPGVLNFWKSNQTTMHGEKDLRQEASNAQKLRYLELEHRLAGLQDEMSQTLAARLAFFPRLNSETWRIFRDLLLNNQAETTVDALVDAKVLEDERFPTYGHDTKHTAARHWLVKNKPRLIRREAEKLITAAASRVTGISEKIGSEQPFLEALIGCSKISREVGADPEICCLTDAARAVFYDVEGVFHSRFDAVYPDAIRRNSSTAPLVGISLFIRGSLKGARGDSDGEIADCTAIIDMLDGPAELVADALIARGTRKGEQNDFVGEIADYTAIIDLPDAPTDIVARALFCRGTRKVEQGNAVGAIADYGAVIELPNAPTEWVAKALTNRGTVKRDLGDAVGAIADFTAVIQLPNAPDEWVAHALSQRGFTKEKQGEAAGATADYKGVMDLPDAPSNLLESVAIRLASFLNYSYAVGHALVNRGLSKMQRDDVGGAIADFTSTINATNAAREQKERALMNRGILRYRGADFAGAMADFTAVIDLPDTPPTQVAQALMKRGVVCLQSADFAGAMADFTAVIDLPDAPATEVAQALINRGAAKGQLGDITGQITDCSAVIDLPDVLSDEVARALTNRGVAKGRLGDSQGAIADYTAVIDLPNAPHDHVARALVNRGVVKGQLGDSESEISDYTAVIDLLDAPHEQIAKALVNRGSAKEEQGDLDGAIADYTALMTLPNAPIDVLAVAERNLRRASQPRQ